MSLAVISDPFNALHIFDCYENIASQKTSLFLVLNILSERNLWSTQLGKGVLGLVWG